MRAITYTRLGDPSVLELVEKPIPEPGDGEVRIRVLVSGVNPTDWKSRSGTFGGGLTEATVPNHDGAGVVDAVGAGVTGFRVGDRVWVTHAGDGRPAGGTAQEFTVVPADHAFALPAGPDFELGASIAAFDATGPFGTPLDAPGSGIIAPWLCARSPTAGLLTSWHVPHMRASRWKADGIAACLALLSL